MDYRAVLILLCMFCTQAPCRPPGSGATEEAIRLLLQEIRGILDHLADPGLLPNVTCSSLNIKEHIGLKHQPLVPHRLSSVRCYKQELSQRIPELSERLMTGAHIIQDIERQSSNLTTPQNCSLPAFEQELNAYVFAKCFLQLVEKDLSS